MAQNYYRLVTVLVNIGAKVLRRYLQHHSGYASLSDLLNGEMHKLYHSWFPRDNGNCCCSARVAVNRSNITKDQFEMLFYKTATSPPCSHSGLHHCWHKVKTGINFDILDITLARLLIVNVITTLSTVDSAALDKIRELRNFLAHSPEISISDHDFELRWNAAKAKILHLANTLPFPFSIEIEQDIDGLKTQSLDDGECNRLREAVKELRQTDRLLEEMSDRLVHGIDKLSDDISDVQSTTQTVLETTQSAHRENLELKAEIQEVKGEVKGVRNDIQEIKTDFQGMKCEEIHRDPRLKQLIENTELMLKTHQKNLYVPGNRAEKAAYERLCGNHHITISGRGGQGKTTLGKHLMHKFCNEQLVGQERYTPIILEKAKDFDLINGKDCFIILIDDPFGKSNRDKGHLEEWESHFEKILSFIKEGNICMIMCIRLSILKDSSDTLVKYDLFSGENWVDLTSDSYRLTENERFAMLKAYCEKHNVRIFNQKENVVLHSLSQTSPDKMDAKAISPISTTGTQIEHSTLKEISESDPFLGFPQSCQLFFSRKSFFDKGLEFFKEPDESVKNDIYHMKESAPLQYIVFVFMMLQGGGIDLNELDEEKLEALCKCLDVKCPSTEDIKECVRYGVSGVYIQKLDSSTSVSKGVQQLVYIFTHETVLESVLLSFGKRYPEILLQFSEDRLLFAFARPTGYKRKPGEICVSVPIRCHRQLAERFVLEYSYFGIDRLLYELVYSRFYTDESFVQDVFDVMDEDYVNFRKRNNLFITDYSIGNFCKTDKDVVQFVVAVCKRFALYNQTSSKEYVGEEQCLGKLKLPLDLFIELLHNITETGENDAVKELVDLSGLDLHLRYCPDIVAEENESDKYEDMCNVDERCININFSGKSKFFYHSFGNPVCYACILGYKNLVLRFLDIMDTVILDEVTERLVYLLTERDWLDVLQKLIDKNRSVLLNICLSKLLYHVLWLRRKSIVLYFLDFDVDLNLTDKYGLILLLHCCQNDWDDIFDKVLQKDKNAIQQNGLSPSLLALQAAKYNRQRIVLYLLQYDIDLSVCDKNGQTLLHYCCVNDGVDVFDKILEKNKDVLSKLDMSPSVLILHAAKYHREKMALRLLQFDVDFTLCDENGKTLLHYCCEHDWVDVFEKILEKDKDVLSKPDMSPSDLILLAARYKSTKMISNLLRYEVDFTVSDENGETLLHYCCEHGWVDVFDNILDKDQEVLRKPGLSPSALVLHAACYKRKQMVSHLMAFEVDFTLCDANDKTLLHYCCEYHWVDIFEKILEKDKDVLSKVGICLSSLVNHAAKCRNRRLVLQLLPFDFDLAVGDKDGNTLIHYCCENGWVDTFEKILEKDKDVLSNPGPSVSDCILRAARCKNLQIVSHLLQYDVDLTVADHNGYSLLHYCCKHDWVDAFDKILEKDEDLLSKSGLSPSALVLHAAKNCKKKMASHLLKFEIDFTERDVNGKTLLHYCCQHDWVDVFDKVIAKDKDVLSDPGLSPSVLVLHAAKLCSVQVVLRLIQYDVDFTVCDENGETLLHYCCKHGWVFTLDKVIAKDKDVLSKADLSPSALVNCAAKYYSKWMVLHLLEYDLDFTLCDKKGFTLLHYCCKHDWVDVFGKILEKRKDVLSNLGLSPSVLVLCAARFYSKRMILLLLNHDVDFTVRDNRSKTLLHYCCEFDWVAVFDQILQKDKIVLSKPETSPSVLILHAASHKRTKMVLHLLQYDVDFTLFDKKNKTLLIYCCENDWLYIFNLILQKDKVVMSKTVMLPSFLAVVAAIHQSMYIESLLLQHYVSFAVLGENGKTFLHYCCEFDLVDTFEKILEKDKDVLNKPGLSPSVLVLHAAKSCKKKMVSHLLKYDVDFTLHDDSHKTLLHYCCEHDWVDVFEKMLEKDKEVLNKPDMSPSALVLHAAEYSKKEMVLHLLKYDVDFAGCDGKGKTLLHYCCEHDWVDVFEEILEKDKDVLGNPKASPSVLMLHAAYYCKKEMVSKLLNFDMDFTVCDEKGQTLLHYCCEHNWVDVFEKILEKDKVVLNKPDMSPSALVLHAAKYSEKEMVLHLLKYDVDFSVCDGKGKTLLHYCSECDWVDVFEKILEKDKDVLSKPGLSPSVLLVHAAKYSKKEMVLHLLKYDVDFAGCDEKGNTLLHYCCEYDWVDVFEKILEKDKEVLSKPGLSPSVLILHAAEDSKKEMASKLLKFDVDFTVCDGNGKTLLHYCCEYDWVDVFKEILEKDKDVLNKPKTSTSFLVLNAAEYRRKKMVFHLLHYEVDFTECAENGKTLLHYCSEYNWNDVFDKILEIDKDVLGKQNLSPSVLILCAANNKSMEMILNLLRYEVDLTVFDENGKTLLRYCCEYDWVDVFDKILQKDPEVLDKPDTSPSVLILHAASYKSTQMILHLLQYDVDFPLSDKKHNTLLKYCCENDWLDIFKKILQKDKDVLSKTVLLPSFLAVIAAIHQSMYIESLLLQHYVSFAVLDENRKTFLHYCCEFDLVDTFEKILEKDKDVLNKPGLSPSVLVLHAAKSCKKKMVSRLLKFDVDFTLHDDSHKTLLHYCCEHKLFLNRS